jgi:hypothetical protein
MVLRTPSRDEMPRRRWMVLEASFLDEEEAEDNEPGFTVLMSLSWRWSLIGTTTQTAARARGV